MKPTNTHLGLTYHWVKSPDGLYVVWLWSDNDNAYGWFPFGWDGLSVMLPSSVPEGWEYVSYISMPVGAKMVNIVTQKMTIEAVSNDLSCKEIMKRLESVGIIASSLEVKPLNNREEQSELDRVTQRLHDIMEWIDRKNEEREV